MSRKTTSPFPETCKTLIGILAWRAQTQPDETAYIFLDEQGKETGRTSYSALYARVQALAAELRDAGLSGSRALMMYADNRSFVEAFYACLLARIVAVPVHPGAGKRALLRLASVLKSCRPQAILSRTETATALAAATQGMDLGPIKLLGTDEMGLQKTHGSLDLPEPSEIAFLQYTSGSTSEPKGTIVSHGNIMANQRMGLEAMRMDEHEAPLMVSWLPTFHDMGLIGSVMHPLYVGFPAVLLPTQAFVRDPLVWLRTITAYRATLSSGPNFGYEACVSSASKERLEGLDLGSWKVALNGAEPVRTETMDAFTRLYSRVGFSASAWLPAYGLAEGTLMISGTPYREPRLASASSPASTPALVSCGRTNLGDQTLRIVDPVTLGECPDRAIGEIWISGSHVAQGYWGNREASEAVFGATLGGERFLRTGDLGFLSEGELYVSGRLKDLIIIHGQNHYPQDLERTAESVDPAVRRGCVAAFSLEQGATEAVVVVAEIAAKRPDGSETPRGLAAAIREEIIRSHQLPVSAVILIQPNTISKTTSGKIQRRACKTAHLEGRLAVVERVDGPAESEAPLPQPGKGQDLRSWILENVASRAGIPVAELDVTRSFADYAISSAVAVELVAGLSRRLGRRLDVTNFWACRNIAEFVAQATDPGAPKAEPRISPDFSARSVRDLLELEIAKLEAELKVEA